MSRISMPGSTSSRGCGMDRVYGIPWVLLGWMACKNRCGCEIAINCYFDSCSFSFYLSHYLARQTPQLQPILQFIYHQTFHIAPIECIGGGNVAKCIMLKDSPDVRHYKTLQKSVLEVKLAAEWVLFALFLLPTPLPNSILWHFSDNCLSFPAICDKFTTKSCTSLHTTIIPLTNYCWVAFFSPFSTIKFNINSNGGQFKINCYMNY